MGCGKLTPDHGKVRKEIEKPNNSRTFPPPGYLPTTQFTPAAPGGFLCGERERKPPAGEKGKRGEPKSKEKVTSPLFPSLRLWKAWKTLRKLRVYTPFPQPTLTPFSLSDFLPFTHKKIKEKENIRPKTGHTHCNSISIHANTN